MQQLCVTHFFNLITERSFGDDEEEQAKAEGSGEAKEEIKIPEPTLDPDLQIFCKLIFNSEQV
jgi:hypothetical protein